MSDHIPFEIQMEIMKRFPVKSLIQFRSVSKAWKSLIDSSDFIKLYSGRQQHLLLRYDLQYKLEEPEYVSIVDDDTFPGHKVSPTIPVQLNILENSRIIGNSHGLLCLYGYYYGWGGRVHTAVLWNISIRKAVDVVVPNVAYGKYATSLGFGVCGKTIDPKIVKVTYIASWKDIESIPDSIPSQVEVFTVSTGAWRRPYSCNLPRKSITFHYDQVVVDGVLYWIVSDRITTDGGFRSLNLIISFDITSEEFREINLPDALAHHQPYKLSISKLKESLVVVQSYGEINDRVFFVWMMKDGVPKSFTKMFTICTPDATIISVPGFRKSGEPIIEILDDFCHPHEYWSLFVYEPYSKHINNIGIREWLCSFSLYNYMETLLLHDQPDLTTNDFPNFTADDIESGEQELNF
ncbi:putative F-box domain-containing protein [Helianthus annuus]|uniref:F-box domain-containing protein n=2 Tax=Helianthus annuus TaxID=4232 RepID=A0A9K3IVR6_HELAN|nr:F-box protein At1g11270 [Helianthus annuus]KAF5803852.1 putative F-box domain-containing protein [Helianthus annuus]KAJ0561753.1 putative F-box domain-containing protein [Helianthus annuus]KAJ0568503.1 putative F-box domain-containing protein [Helianthus annuus]KAJ0574817.1 putative F-box domain-containing protein [Helianthus annuus]KAJ0739148.1 putative F-box domain-containing protein [Helianthus annuus]